MFAPGNAKQVEQSACHRSIVAQALLCCSISFGDHRAPVALAARGRNYRVAKQEGEKKKSGRSKGGGRREPRPRLHPRRPAFTDRPPCLQSKDNAIAVERIPVSILRILSRSARSSHPSFACPNPTCYGPLRNKPATSDMANSTRNMKNSTLAISAAPAAMPPNPNTAAISATTKNTSA